MTAGDGGGVAGVTVTFAAANGGSVATASVVTGNDGTAQTSWTLGATPGPQSATASVTGLTGSPVTFTATANPANAGKIAITTSPSGTVTAGVAFGVVVTAQDSKGNPAGWRWPAYNGNVTLALASNPASDALGGTISVNAVNGVASFTALTLKHVASNVTIVASSDPLAAVISPPFNVGPGRGQTSFAGLSHHNRRPPWRPARTLGAVTVAARDQF